MFYQADPPTCGIMVPVALDLEGVRHRLCQEALRRDGPSSVYASSGVRSSSDECGRR